MTFALLADRGQQVVTGRLDQAPGTLGVGDQAAAALARLAAFRGDLGRRNPYSWYFMSKHGRARTVLAGMAITSLAGIALAGCSVPAGTAPDVPGETTGGTAAGATSPGSSAAPITGTRPGATSKPVVTADSLPFPVAVGNTWVYRTKASIGGQTGTTTNKIVSAGPASAGYRVTMSSTTDVAGAAAAADPVYLFYPNGTIGYPVTQVNGVPVAGGGVVWPDAAGLASGRAYHSLLRIRVSQTGQYENADVTVQGAGTVSVSVPAGTYRALVVDTTIAPKAGSYTTIVEVKTWIAQGTGVVKTEVLIHAAGKTELTMTNELLSFTKGSGRADGS